MSQFTTCNYCALQKVVIDNPGKKVDVIEDGVWLRVLIDGDDASISFLVLTDHCVC